MIHDLDATLAALLEAEMAEQDLTISFAAPDGNFPPGNVTPPALSLFLYELRENWALRHSSDWELERGDDGVVTRTPPPKRVDCAYLVTAWPSLSAPDPVQDEHRLLGEAMKALLRHRELPAEYLRGELAGHEPPVRSRVLADIELRGLGELRELGEFWQAMGGTPRAALRYGITLAVDVAEPEPLGPLVTEAVIHLTPNGTTVGHPGGRG